MLLRRSADHTKLFELTDGLFQYALLGISTVRIHGALLTSLGQHISLSD